MVLALIASLFMTTVDTVSDDPRNDVPLNVVMLRIRHILDSAHIAQAKSRDNYKKTCPECFRTDRSCGKEHVGDVTWICIEEPEEDQ